MSQLVHTGPATNVTVRDVETRHQELQPKRSLFCRPLYWIVDAVKCIWKCIKIIFCFICWLLTCGQCCNGKPTDASSKTQPPGLAPEDVFFLGVQLCPTGPPEDQKRAVRDYCKKFPRLRVSPDAIYNAMTRARAVLDGSNAHEHTIGYDINPSNQAYILVTGGPEIKRLLNASISPSASQFWRLGRQDGQRNYVFLQVEPLSR